MAEQPILETERLLFFQPVKDDAYRMLEIVSDPRTARFLGSTPSPSDNFTRFLRNAGSWMLFGYGGMIVRLKSTGELIGNCGIFHSWRGLGDDFDDSPEAGWIIAGDHVGKGLGFEAMQAIFKWFDRMHGSERVVCMIATENVPSLKLAGKLGFAEMREADLPDGDTVVLLERLRG